MSDFSLGDLEHRLDSMEKKISDAVSRLDESVAKLQKQASAQSPAQRGRWDRVFWGSFIVLLGFLWFASSAGWIEMFGVSWWPIILIAFGLYLIMGGGR